MLLRALDAHPQVFVCGQVTEGQPRQPTALARWALGLTLERLGLYRAVAKSRFGRRWVTNSLLQALMHYEPLVIDRASLAQLRVHISAERRVIVVKQGTWEHRHRFRGLVLARNPASIWASLKGLSGESNRERLGRWFLHVDPTMWETIRDQDLLHQFCAFYNRRMGALAKLGLPTIHYERFVERPEWHLRRILGLMRLPFSERCLLSHRGYAAQAVGHGGIDLARPIDRQSLSKYRSALTEREFERLARMTRQVTDALGYVMTWGQIQAPEPEL